MDKLHWAQTWENWRKRALHLCERRLVHYATKKLFDIYTKTNSLLNLFSTL